ncbi:MAG: hypothetical protein ACKVXR_16650 [Planctomycetota bacterium]
MRRELDGSKRSSLAAAMRELAIVHRRDQARLLRVACALVCTRSRLGRLYVAGFAHGPRIRWDRACAEEIESAGADDFQVDPLLPRLLGLSSELWPRATSLAEAALALLPCHEGRIDLARAKIAEADAPGAIGDLRELLRDGPLPDVRGAALEALALALELEGDSRASIACYGAAAQQSRSDPRVCVALLALALRVEDRPGISLAARRLEALDLTVSGSRLRFDRALKAARGRARRAPRDEIGWPILEMAFKGSGACSEVARGLL